MSYSKPRTDVRKALEEALASGAQVKIEGAVLESKLEEVGYVKFLASDRIIFSRYKDGPPGTSTMLPGVPTMIGDIKTVSFWQEPGEPRNPSPDPEPVGDPPPKAGAPGKREKVPTH